ncbi:hypothetical protein COP00_03825 [Bacillus glycinifermentans]|uniref:Uncharacterized protein n=1 Tax=Bacillus glycinifermentans TaxID=1664069 RepID=A0A0T6BI97_9BACI|nr:hypothetical protein COP00_03825 [Bacillus glycinifermentans]KRT87262.1 hypothetical protein AB447_208475 [Bacillus glycinifermentans]
MSQEEHEGKIIKKPDKKIERSFADLKQLHELRYYKIYGKAECDRASASRNQKKIAARGRCAGDFFRFLVLRFGL